MLLLCLPLLCLSKCGHVRVASRRRPQIDVSRFVPLSNSERKPIRVHFNLRSLTDRDDANTCYEGDAGKKSVYFRSEFPMMCTEDAEMVAWKLNVLQQTLTNVENYVARFLTVEPLSEPVTANYSNVAEGQEQTEQPNKTIEYTADGVDLHIVVVARFGNTMEGVYAATDITDYAESGRPIAGCMVVNPQYIQRTAQNYVDWDHRYFSVFLHELMHVLAWSYKLFPIWNGGKAHLPKEIKNPLNNKSIGVTLDPILVIDTPEVRNELIRRFGRETFPDGSDFGLQLDDRADPEGLETHFKTTYYMSDLMIPFGDLHTRMSNLTLCGLYDSGWYGVDFRYAEPVFYGNGPVFGEKPLTNFPVSLPSKELRDIDLCTENNEGGCYADPRIKPEYLCSYVIHPPNCTTECEQYQQYCQNQTNLIYNPSNGPMRDVAWIDFQNMKWPVEMCPASHFCASSSAGAACYHMECTENASKLVIYDGNNYVECTYLETVPLGNINITCPDPRIICPLASEYDPSTGLPVWAIGAISGSAAVVTGAVSIGVFCAKRRKKSKPKTYASGPSLNSTLQTE